MDQKLSNQNPEMPAAPAHAAEEGFDRGEPNARVIALTGSAIILVVVVVIFAIQYLYDRAHEQQVAVMVEQPVGRDLLDLRAKEDTDLYQYRYVDRTKGIVRLPIDRAMDLFVKEAAEGKLKYPTAPAPVKTAADVLAQSGTRPQAVVNGNAATEPAKTN